MKKINIIRVIAITVSILFLIRYSNAELLSWFPENLAYFFLKPQNSDGILFSLFVGYLVSEIFYFIVVFLPEKRKRKYIFFLTKKKIDKIIDYRNKLFDVIITAGGLNKNSKELKHIDFEAISLVRNLHEYSKTYSNVLVNPKQLRYMEIIKQYILLSQDELKEILNFAVYLDPQITYEIDDVLHCGFFRFIDFFTYNGSEIGISGLENEMKDYYFRVEKLKNYCN